MIGICIRWGVVQFPNPLAFGSDLPKVSWGTRLDGAKSLKTKNYFFLFCHILSGGVSGGHLNPAVTLAMAAIKKLKPIQIPVK